MQRKEHLSWLCSSFSLPSPAPSILNTLHVYAFGCWKSAATTGHQTLFPGISLNRDCSYKPKGQITISTRAARKDSQLVYKCFQQNPLMLQSKAFSSLSLIMYLSTNPANLVIFLTIAATEYLAREGHFTAQPPASIPAEPLPPLAPSAEKPVSGDLKLLISRPGLTNCQD